jgi:hypothetical protein
MNTIKWNKKTVAVKAVFEANKDELSDHGIPNRPKFEKICKAHKCRNMADIEQWYENLLISRGHEHDGYYYYTAKAMKEAKLASKTVATRTVVKPNKPPVFWNGKQYKNVNTLQKSKNGVNRDTYIKYTALGINTTKGVKEHQRKAAVARRSNLVWNGKTYSDIYVAAKKLGVSLATVEYRKSKGYTKDTDMLRASCYGITVEFKGKRYGTISDAVVRNASKFSACHIRKNSKFIKHNRNA